MSDHATPTPPHGDEPLAAAYRYAAARCAKSECCRADLLPRLVGRGLTAAQAEQVLDRLAREGYIDESRYARAYTADKFRFSRWGRVKIRYMLRLKGIDEADIGAALATIEDEEYASALADFLKAKRTVTRGADGRAVREKVARAAIARGYEPQLVFARLGDDDSPAPLL